MATKEEVIPKTQEEKLRAMEIACAALNKEYGANSILKLGTDDFPQWPSISTGAPSLDFILSINGLPRGRIVEIYGPESSGKTTLAMSIIAQAQAMGEVCAFIDVEHALDPTYAKAVGVDMKELWLAQPQSAETALNIIDRLSSTGGPSVIVLDSVAALTTQSELNGDVGDSHVGTIPRLMGQTLRKINHNVAQTDTLVIFINQIREKIGVMFGSPETQPGGRALKFFSSVRLDVRKIEVLKDKDTGDIAGVKVKAKVIKNKMGAPYREAEFRIIYGKGIDYNASLVDLCLTRGILEKGGGGWIKRDGENISRSDLTLARELDDDTALRDELKRIVLA